MKVCSGEFLGARASCRQLTAAGDWTVVTEPSAPHPMSRWPGSDVSRCLGPRWRLSATREAGAPGARGIFTRQEPPPALTHIRRTLLWQLCSARIKTDIYLVSDPGSRPIRGCQWPGLTNKNAVCWPHDYDYHSALCHRQKLKIAFDWEYVGLQPLSV